MNVIQLLQIKFPVFNYLGLVVCLPQMKPPLFISPDRKVHASNKLLEMYELPAVWLERSGAGSNPHRPEAS